MVFLLSTLDKVGKSYDFSLMVNIETGLKVISQILAEGETLVSVIILEGEKQYNLPVEAFDGQAYELAFSALEKEWMQVLSDSQQN